MIARAFSMYSMSKHRTVNTHFWDDSYIETLQPVEMLLFLFLITNPQTNIAGVYEITVRRMHERTRIPKARILQILEKFEADDKFIYKDNVMLAVNAIAHQKTDVPTIKTGIITIVSKAPDWVKNRLCIEYEFLSHLILILSNSIPSNPADAGGKPPLREIFFGTIEAGLSERMGIKTLPNQREWHQRVFEWAFINNFTTDAVLETYDLMKKGFWKTKSVSPKSLADNIPNLSILRSEIGNGGTQVSGQPTQREAIAAEQARIKAENAQHIGGVQ